MYSHVQERRKSALAHLSRAWSWHEVPKPWDDRAVAVWMGEPVNASYRPPPFADVWTGRISRTEKYVGARGKEGEGQAAGKGLLEVEQEGGSEGKEGGGICQVEHGKGCGLLCRVLGMRVLDTHRGKTRAAGRGRSAAAADWATAAPRLGQFVRLGAGDIIIVIQAAQVAEAAVPDYVAVWPDPAHVSPTCSCLFRCGGRIRSCFRGGFQAGV